LTATSVDRTGWQDENLLGCASPVTSGAVGALGGNAAAHRTAKDK
jgi:hypothetical protein